MGPLKPDLLHISKCHLIASQYKRAVYSHKTVEDKMQAVQAVLWHNLDHPEATIEQRHTYHQYCTKPWPYIQWITEKNLLLNLLEILKIGTYMIMKKPGLGDILQSWIPPTQMLS